MLTSERLGQKPQIFKAFSGVTVEEFAALLTRVTPVWIECEQQRLARPDRQRALGGGRKPKFALREQLLLTLVWLWLYLPTETLGFLFGIDKATISRYTRALLPALRTVVKGHRAGRNHRSVGRAGTLPKTSRRVGTLGIKGFKTICQTTV